MKSLKPGKSLIRRGPPNQFDQAPKGTICIVSDINATPVLYEQMSDDEENPRWEYKEVEYSIEN